MKIGILGVADIAQRRFLPAITTIKGVVCGGVAVATFGERGAGGNENDYLEHRLRRIEEATELTHKYGGTVYTSYEDLLDDPDIDMVYIPLPPSLHYQWIKKAFYHGKHVLSEKPCTISYRQTKELVSLAREKSLLLLENYAFCYHRQFKMIKDIINSGKLGDIRLVRAAFGFPLRKADDFRYSKKLGGGALLDCGGYTIKLAQEILGKDINIVTANLNYIDDFEVDMFGSVVIRGAQGIEAQLAFGMDNSYKCEMEIWGSKGRIRTDRIFTPPVDYSATIYVQTDQVYSISVDPDDSFRNLIVRAQKCLDNKEIQKSELDALLLQAWLVERAMNNLVKI